ncbi:hypothetical protein CEV08_00950 [Bartonella tribocorum]|uniref:Uncharacterized protein n=2 Tax=Bartonella tribocorum TaxID=85701 RepID=A0A2M6UYC5_9HYPH|nr:hypothetical protein CEV08_00950 [Bartonella tribocorum]
MGEILGYHGSHALDYACFTLKDDKATIGGCYFMGSDEKFKFPLEEGESMIHFWKITVSLRIIKLSIFLALEATEVGFLQHFFRKSKKEIGRRKSV